MVGASESSEGDRVPFIKRKLITCGEREGRGRGGSVGVMEGEKVGRVRRGSRGNDGEGSGNSGPTASDVGCGGGERSGAGDPSDRLGRRWGGVPSALPFCFLGFFSFLCTVN
jgi:hypothetical protein